MTKSERLEAEKDPHHPRHKVVFALYSWWLDKQDREFVISQRWTDNEGRLQYLELLIKNTGKLTVVEYLVFFSEFKAGKMQRTSPYLHDAPPPIPSPYLLADRSA